MTTIKTIFDASERGDLLSLKSYIQKGDNLNAFNEFGFTPLQQAAMGTNSYSIKKIIIVMNELLSEGAEINLKSKDGRSAIYLAAEFSPSIEPIQFLVENGADLNVTDSYGNHIIENAMEEDVQEYISNILGKEVPEVKEERPYKKLTKKEFKESKLIIDKVFLSLTENNLIALQNSGYTQEDAFGDCSQLYHESNKNIIGFCFYTGQDLKRFKDSGQLSLGIWGSPDGKEKSTQKIGKLVTKLFLKENLEVDWDGSSSTRPSIIFY